MFFSFFWKLSEANPRFLKRRSVAWSYGTHYLIDGKGISKLLPKAGTFQHEIAKHLGLGHSPTFQVGQQWPFQAVARGQLDPKVDAPVDGGSQTEAGRIDLVRKHFHNKHQAFSFRRVKNLDKTG